jgi:hypothetical protein
MRPLKIRPFGVFIVSPYILLAMSGAALFAPKNSNAQCPAGNVPMATTYTQPLSASGASVYNFTLPQFNPSPGGYTLLSAVLSATASTATTVNYQNTSTNPQDFFPSLSRTDNVKVNGSTAVNRNNEFDYNETFLSPQGSPGDNITYGPANTFDNSTLFTTTISNAGTLTGTYQGAGNLSLTYTSTFFATNFIPTGVTVTPTLSDNITFSITYNFCNPTSLSSNILTFTAEKENNKTIVLKWSTANEQAGRKYYIEASLGGQDFAIAGSVPSNASSNEANYTYDYAIPAAAMGKIYFRLRQVETNGTATWSDVRIIDLDGNGNNSTFSIYPNPPSDFIYLSIPGDNQDWQVEIMAADGSLVQRNYYPNSNAAKVYFVRRLAAGAYFVRAMNPQTGKHYSGSFLVGQ